MKIQKELKILGIFFENPEKGFQIREIARMLGINHTSIRQHLNTFVKEGYLKIEKHGIYPAYYSNIGRKYTNLKTFYNLELVRESGVIEFLEKEFSYPVIVLFGSYANGTNNTGSDIDIFILSELKKEIFLEKFEKPLKGKINLHILNKKEFARLKEKNPMLVNNLIKGIVLSGELEII